jgi:signal transduction histidine kinase
VRALGRVRLDGRPWRIVQRRIEAREAGPVGRAEAAGRYPTLVLTTALCLDPIDDTLRHLARLLIGLSIGVWLIAAALGRAFCRRALGPLTRMAETAHAMGVVEFDQRLPEPGTGDEIQELAESFNGLLDRLFDAFERQKRFTGDASHQLRTPLAAILGQIDVTLRRDRPSDEYRRTFGLVRDRAAHLSRIVETLLFLARADADAKLPDRHVVELAQWTRDHLRTWASHPRAADVALDVSSKDDDPILARVHTPLLGQLVDNLLDNACKYSAVGTPVRVRLTRGTGKTAGTVALSVQDQGTGIFPEELPHIFEPFFRSPHARREGRPGVGLGLTVAQRIDTAFDGRLEAASSPGQGCLFTLLLADASGEPEVDPSAALAARDETKPSRARGEVVGQIEFS